MYCTTYTYHTLCTTNDNHDNGAPPPRPKLCQNMMRPWAASAKNISADSWGQCALIRRNGQIKSTGIHYKNIPFVPMRAGQRHTEIKEKLVSRKKIALPCCGYWYWLRNIRRSHSPVKLEPLEAGGRGRSWCWCFLEVVRRVLWWCVVSRLVYLCRYSL